MVDFAIPTSHFVGHAHRGSRYAKTEILPWGWENDDFASRLVLVPNFGKILGIFRCAYQLNYWAYLPFYP